MSWSVGADWTTTLPSGTVQIFVLLLPVSFFSTLGSLQVEVRHLAVVFRGANRKLTLIASVHPAESPLFACEWVTCSCSSLGKQKKWILSEQSLSFLPKGSALKLLSVVVVFHKCGVSQCSGFPRQSLRHMDPNGRDYLMLPQGRAGGAATDRTAMFQVTLSYVKSGVTVAQNAALWLGERRRWTQFTCKSKLKKNPLFVLIPECEYYLAFSLFTLKQQ